MIERLAAWASDLLRAADAGCCACGKPRGGRRAGQRFDGRTAAMLDALCVSCALVIPWIDRIACGTCGRAVACPDCVRRESASFVQNRSAVRYDAVMRQWLALYKYRGHERLGPPLAEMLCRAYERMTAEALERCGGRRSARSAPWAAVTYVPVSGERERERGFNQAQQLAEALAARYRLPLYGLLTRIRHSEKQSLKSRRERIRDMRTAFDIDRNGVAGLASAILPGGAGDPSLRILLVDDIYTTGGTVDACAAKLMEATGGRARVYALTWARS